MALIKCQECGKEISDKARHCPNCGYIKPPIKMTKLDSIFIPIIAVFIVVGIVGLCLAPTCIEYSYPMMKKVDNGESQYIYEKVPGSNIAKQKINPNYKSTYDLGPRQVDYSKANIVASLSIVLPTVSIITYIILKKKKILYN